MSSSSGLTEIAEVPENLAPEWRQAFGWIESQLGGKVVRAERQPRWRPAWYLDLERGGETVPLYFRGDRAESDHGAYSLEHEMQVMQVLEQLNIQGTTICMVTHDPRYADMASTQLRLLDGAILSAPDAQSVRKAG